VQAENEDSVDNNLAEVNHICMYHASTGLSMMQVGLPETLEGLIIKYINK